MKRIFALALAAVLVFITCKNDNTDNEPEATPPEPAVSPYTILKITDIPESKKIFAGALFTVSAGALLSETFSADDLELAAAGINNGGSFYLFDAGFTKPWKEEGSFSVGLLEVSDDFTLADLQTLDNLFTGEVFEEQYVYAGFDVAEFLQVYNSIDFTLIYNAEPTVALIVLYPLLQYVQVLPNFSAGIPVYTFNKDDTVELSWNYFISVTEAEQLATQAEPLLEMLSNLL